MISKFLSLFIKDATEAECAEQSEKEGEKEGKKEEKEIDETEEGIEKGKEEINGEKEEKRKTNDEKPSKKVVKYKQHAPRFFILKPDGSGMELLRYQVMLEC